MFLASMLQRKKWSLTISSRPETLWGLTKMMAQDGANCVRRSAPSFLQSPDPFCSPQRVIMMAQFPSHVGWKNKYCGPKKWSLTISSRPETLWGLTKMMAQDGANCVRRSAPSFLQSPDPFCSPQRVIMMAQFPSHVGWKNKYCGPNYIFPSLYLSVTPITTQIWGCRGCKSCGVDLHPILLVTEPLLQSLKGSCTPNFCIWRLAIWDRFLTETRYRGSHSDGKIQRTLVSGNLTL